MTNRNDSSFALLRSQMQGASSVTVTTMELSRDDVLKGLAHAMPTSAHDADAQLAEARRAAHAWLRATLAMLPAAVTSLSVGAVLDESGDRPDMVPRLKASVFGGEWSYPTDGSQGAEGTPLGNAMSALYFIDDDLRDRTRPFLFAIADEEWITVTRADLSAPLAGATVSFAPPLAPFRYAIPVPCPSAAEAEKYRSLIAMLHDLPAGGDLDVRVERDDDGVLRWAIRR